MKKLIIGAFIALMSLQANAEISQYNTKYGKLVLDIDGVLVPPGRSNFTGTPDGVGPLQPKIQLKYDKAIENFNNNYHQKDST